MSSSPDLTVRHHTSITDNQVYPQTCLDAAHNYRHFADFRRHPEYMKALEHVPEKVGRMCLALIQRDPSIASMMSRFLENDLHGNPVTFDAESLGPVSATTLRYVKILLDLKKFFGDLNRLDISEIGVGYGGQCRVINVLWKPASYQLVDIQPALALAQRYLDHFVMNSSMRYRTMNELVARDYDLMISNYAFTELNRSVQEVYMERILTRSKRGYMIYNDIAPGSFDSIRLDELLERIEGAQVFRENPLTHRRNCVVVWGHNPVPPDPPRGDINSGN